MVAGGFIMTTSNQATFPGFQFPNTTQIPNEVFDTLMSKLSGGELKVLLYICRRTFGFRKDSDRISLTQIAHGITTKAGRVLDQGTGLSKRHVITALKTLEKRNIIKVSRTIDETGLHEINTYSLNIVDAASGVGTKCPHGVVNPSSPGGGEKSTPEVVNASSPTKQREQKKEEQKKDIVVDVAQDLENFGIANSAVETLTQSYPAKYIREKLEMARGLVAARSSLVSQNPAGWLRRAIEENYSPPRNTETHQQPSTRKKKADKVILAEPKKQHRPHEAPKPIQTVPTEQREPEKPDRENQIIWLKTIDQLKEAHPLEDVEARLAGTTLLQVTDTAAHIGVNNPFAIAWLERRLYGQIAKALKGVVGRDLDLQFIPAS